MGQIDRCERECARESAAHEARKPENITSGYSVHTPAEVMKTQAGTGRYPHFTTGTICRALLRD